MNYTVKHVLKLPCFDVKDKDDSTGKYIYRARYGRYYCKG